MIEARGDLAARKQLLLARSTLQRLKLRHEASSLRRSLLAPRTALSIITSPPVSSLLLSALLLVAGRHRASRLLRRVVAVFAIVKAARAWMRPPDHPEDSPGP